MPVPAAMRVAHFAAHEGRGAAFVLAATRLAFAGGFDLDDLEILTEAAAAAGLRLDHCLRAAREERRDGAIEAAARRLLGAGADRLPALSVSRGVFSGEDRVGDAVATARMHAAAAAAAERPRIAGARARRGCALRRDEPSEDLRVQRLARLVAALGAARSGSGRRGRSRASSSSRSASVICVFGSAMVVPSRSGDVSPAPVSAAGGATPRPGG